MRNHPFRAIIFKTTAFFPLLFLLAFLFSCHGGGGRRPVTPAGVLNLNVGVPVTDTVASGGVNDYSASTSPGAFYKISVTNRSDDAVLTYFATDNTFQTVAQCDVTNPNITTTSPEDCIVQASGSVIFFSVDGLNLPAGSATFTIDVEAVPLQNINSTFPVSDSTTPTGAKLYTFPTVTQNYTVSMTGLDDDADLEIDQFEACSPNNTRGVGTEPEDCTFTGDGGTAFFIVDGLFSSAPTVHFTVLAEPTPNISSPVNEGAVVSPILETIGTPDNLGQVGFGGESFYQASGLTPGQHYTVSITGLSADADLNLFNDNTFSTPVTCNIDNTRIIGDFPEDCTFTAQGTIIYFSVTRPPLTGSGGAAFINLVQPGP